MPIDLSHRHRQPEIMDAANLPASLFVDTLKGLGRVNAVTRSSRIMWPDLKAAAMRHPDRPIRVLDVACGGGGVLLALWRLARRGGMKVELEGCDASPEAVRYSRETAEGARAPIGFFQHDVTLGSLPGGYDMIMSTLFLHHLEEQAAVAFLCDVAAKAKDRVVIQDLVRSGVSYWFTRVGTSLLLLTK